MPSSTRRNFIKKSAAITALSTVGIKGETLAHQASQAKIDLCLAYFYGLQKRKMELSKQMGVTGVVSPF
jgi:mannonate dehydratase